MKVALSLIALLVGAAILADLIGHRNSTLKVPAAKLIVIDGDTIDYGGDSYRLVGFDTPETFRPQCAAEKTLGLKATKRLTELIQTAGIIDLEIEDDVDRHGRFLAVGRVDGHDVGVTLISEGLAREYWGGKRLSWCP
ncbi:thermonuclease family protein [Ruegeria sp. MALMAid1280]|uniref:thermonuclease family protein n=1 Tax=Ruegeria sp. MALMAid1280 TaxID=3411634 RepID=UPI003BA34456